MWIWFKEWKDNRLLKDTEVTDVSDDTRTHKIMHALEEACHTLDLGMPIWLDSTIREFQLHHKARFTQDAFLEEIPFDYLEIHVLEE